MANLLKLKPCRERHAVKEAVLTVFAKTPIGDFDSFGKLMERGFADYFKKFEILNQAQFQISLNENSQPNFNSTSLSPNGFKFLDFEDGKTVRVFQGLNESSRSYFSFHELNYIRWNNFREIFEKCIQLISDFKGNLEVSAYSLHVIDEFEWQDRSPIPYSDIFRSNNRLIPPIFLESETIDFLISRNNAKKDKFNSNGLERVQVIGSSLNTDYGSKLIISHNFTEVLSASEEAKMLIRSEAFQSIVNDAHRQNKALIQELFSDEVLNLIEFNTN
jgi:uncharacterized protein (TIGR04255 family)